jgi:hypothetical protein
VARPAAIGPALTMEPERLASLSELYTRSAGDARQGVPYEALIDAMGFDERVTKRIQCDFQRERLVELTAVPRMTTVGRLVMDHAQWADPSANDQHDTPGGAAHAGPLRDARGHGTPHTLGVSTGVRARSWSTRDGGLDRFSWTRLLQAICVTLQ